MPQHIVKIQLEPELDGSQHTLAFNNCFISLESDLIVIRQCSSPGTIVAVFNPDVVQHVTSEPETN